MGSVTTLRKHEDGSFASLSNGGQLIYTHNSILVNVTNGYVALSFSGYAGQVVTFALGAGNCFEFEPESFTIEATAKNVKDVVVHFDGVDYFIPPGKRSQIVEPVFGQIKHNQQFRRWSMHGLESCKAQWTLHCSTWNLRKIYKRWKELSVGSKTTRTNLLPHFSRLQTA